MNRLANPFIGSTAAEVAVHRLSDLVVGRVGRLREQGRGGHDLSRLAVAALWNFFGDPGLLQHVQAIGSEAFDRGDALAGDLRDGSGAGTNRIAIDVNRAGAAQSGAATAPIGTRGKAAGRVPWRWQCRSPTGPCWPAAMPT